LGFSKNEVFFIVDINKKKENITIGFVVVIRPESLDIVNA
jgi:hypothetical protein